MLTSGEIKVVDLGEPRGRGAGFPRPAVVVTAQAVLLQGPNVVHVVPLTTKLREFGSEIELTPADHNGLDEPSAAQCQHVRAVAVARLTDTVGHVGPETLAQIREVIADLLDL